MPLEQSENDPEKASSQPGQPVQKDAVSQAAKSLRKGRRDGAEVALRRSSSGLDPRQAIHEWLLFAQQSGHDRVTGKRRFSSDLDRVDTCIDEEQSLFEFCRSRKIARAGKIAALLKGPPTREGVEHRVFYSLKDDPPRVTKVTFPGKYGRIEHTPYLYLERLALFNELFSPLDVRFEDCVKTSAGDYSIISSMRAFSGPCPDLDEIHAFLTGLGFVKLSDGSTTIDYINRELKIILRDCHQRNWVKIKNGPLIPIDLCPEIA